MSWPLFGAFWTSLSGPLSQEAARQQESGPGECKEPPKRHPREPKRSPKKLFCRFFFGASFWTLFGTPLRRVSWTLGLSKTKISLGRSYKNAASPRSPPRVKNNRKSSKNGTWNRAKNYEKRRAQKSSVSCHQGHPWAVLSVAEK